MLQLQLLLTYIQNGITEEWQKIPSVIAIFAAEASFVLLDPSHNHYFTLSKFLMYSDKMNMKVCHDYDGLMIFVPCHITTTCLPLYLLYLVTSIRDLIATSA